MKRTPKIVVINLDVDIPATELTKVATVTVEGRPYQGKVDAIVEYVAPPAVPAIPASTTIKLTGPGLIVTP